MRINKTIILLVLSALVSPLLAQNKISIEINYSKAYDLNRDVYGCNNWISTRPYYLNNNSFIKKYNDLGKPTMRYPGGTASNYLNLATGFHELWAGAGDKDISRINSFNSGMNNAGKGAKGEEIGKFIDFLSITDAKSTFVLNLTVMSFSEVSDILDSILTKGEELDYVEMGNELYYGQYSPAIPNVSSYISLAKERAELVKSKFPNAKIGVLIPSQIYTSESFLPGEGDSQDRQELWYEALKHEDFYDGIVIHIYSSVGMNGNVSSSDFLPYQTAYNYAIAHADKKFKSSFSKLDQDFPGKEIWVTEYHVGGFSGDVRQYRLRHSYLGGLYASNFMLKLFSNRNVTLGSWHSMVQWLTYSSNESLLDENYNFGTTINYNFFKLFGEPVNNSDQFVKVNFNDILNYSGIGDYTGTFNDVEGACFFNSETGKAYLIVFNKWGNTYNINKSSLQENLLGSITKCIEITPDQSISLDDALRSENDFSQSSVEPSYGDYSILPYSVYVFKYDIEMSKIPTSTGTKKSSSNSIKIYPNPSNGSIRIENSSYIGNTCWCIFNNTGQLISNGNFDGKSTSISLATKGVYILRVVYNGLLKLKKF